MTRHKAILLAGLALGAAGAVVQFIVSRPRSSGRRRGARGVRTYVMSVDQAAAAARIRAGVLAARPGLDDFESALLVQAVLAWARGESGLGRAMQGDLRWAFEHPEAYRTRVLGNEVYASNPARTDRSAWRSYGFFHQLAADWFAVAIQEGIAAADAHPSILADPDVSVRLGVPMVLRFLAAERDHGWPEAFIRARLAAKGCGSDGSRCSADTVARARANALRVLEEFQILDVGPTSETLDASIA